MSFEEFKGFGEVRVDRVPKKVPIYEHLADEIKMLSDIPQYNLNILQSHLALSSRGGLGVFKLVEGGEEYGFDEDDQEKIRSLLKKLAEAPEGDGAALKSICKAIVSAVGG